MARTDKARLDAEFTDFVAGAWRGWVHTARLLTRDPVEAEDLVQQVLARTYAAWGRVRRGNPHAYVRRALVNAYLDGRRRRRVLTFAPVPHEDRVLEGASPDPAPGAEARADLRALLATLTPRERAVVVMRHYLDLSQAEVAETLGLPPGTVAACLSRSLAKLRVAADASPTPTPEESLR